MPYSILKAKVTEIISQDAFSTTNKLKNLCRLLKESIDHYDWVGFYFANYEEKRLHLRAYAGTATDHTVIPFGKGICGQVAESNSNFVVPDVSAQDNYISCNINVKSEIVIPLFKDGKNIGQIDIDSNTIDPFTKEDEIFLEWLTKEVAQIM